MKCRWPLLFISIGYATNPRNNQTWLSNWNVFKVFKCLYEKQIRSYNQAPKEDIVQDIGTNYFI